jgi:hypothetical protein
MKATASVDVKSNFRGISFLTCAAFAFILFGIKLWLIKTYGNATPFQDQWDAEADQLYRPFLDGTLCWKDLFSTHNEHRILVTRLYDLALLCINGIWNPLLQMVVNAALHVATLVCGIVLLTRVIGKNYLLALLAFSLFLFGIPFAWENTLTGFQAQFYFVLLFSIACLWLTVMRAALSPAWWIGILCAILAFFSLASGIFAPLASAIVGLVFYATGLRKTAKQLAAAAILVGLFVVGWLLTPTLSYHAALKANSILQFLDALKAVLAWPMRPQYISALILNVPGLIYSGLVLWKRPPADDRKWFLLALNVWTIGQAASVAYGRATDPLQSRYQDLFLIGILVNFTCLISLAQNKLGKFNKWKIVGVGAWVAIVLASLALYAYEEVPNHLVVKREFGICEELQTRRYLATGNFIDLVNQPWGCVPYPDPARFASVLAFPSVAAILPANIRLPLTAISIESNPIDAFVAGGYSPSSPKRSEMTWGNYGAHTNAATGQASIRFEAKRDELLAIPVAGYPLAGGNKIEIIQDGQRHPVALNDNPENSWGVAYVNVKKGPFSLLLSETSNANWFAIEAPYVVGSLDALTKHILDNYFVFMLLGGILGFASLVLHFIDKRDGRTPSRL